MTDSPDAVLARQAGPSSGNRRGRDGNSSNAIEIFDGKQWVRTDLASLPPTIALVPTNQLFADTTAGTRILPVLDLPGSSGNELGNRRGIPFVAGQTILIAPGEATQEVRRVISVTRLGGGSSAPVRPSRAHGGHRRAANVGGDHRPVSVGLAERRLAQDARCIRPFRNTVAADRPRRHRMPQRRKWATTIKS